MLKSIRLAIRKLAIKALKVTAFNTRIRHHWVPDRKVLLNTFKHKGYWWTGADRERASLLSVAKIVKPGDGVWEVGGHIGYLSVYFAHLTGPSGSVVVFEPDDENRRYLTSNVEGLGQVKILPLAVSNAPGEADFFVEDLTGQNNSLVGDYHVLKDNAARAGINVNVRKVKVQVTTLDALRAGGERPPSLIKIDVEGAEFNVLEGAQDVLKNDRPVLFLEVTRDSERVGSLLRKYDYDMLTDSLEVIVPGVRGSANVFCVPSEKRAALLQAS